MILLWFWIVIYKNSMKFIWNRNKFFLRKNIIEHWQDLLYYKNEMVCVCIYYICENCSTDFHQIWTYMQLTSGYVLNEEKKKKKKKKKRKFDIDPTKIFRGQKIK